MAKAKYINDGAEFPSVEAYQQPNSPEYWYVHFGERVFDVSTATSAYDPLSDVDRLITVLEKIKKEAGK